MGEHMSVNFAPTSTYTPATTVSTPTGSTVLPGANSTDFAQSPTPLDEKDATYPTLITSHVATLRAAGTPEAFISQLAASTPTAQDLDEYIQSDIFAVPESWDANVGNPAGTARAGLEQLIPGFSQKYPAPAGTPVVLPQATITTTPGAEPGFGFESMVMGVLAGGLGVAGVVVGAKLFKNHRLAKAGGEAALQAAAGPKGVVGASAGADVQALLPPNASTRTGEDLVRTGKESSDPKAFRIGSSLTAAGSRPDLDEGTHLAASTDSALRGLGFADGELTSLNFAALNANIPIQSAVDMKIALLRARAELALAQAENVSGSGGVRTFMESQPSREARSYYR